MISIEPFDEKDGTLKSPLTKFAQEVDLSRYKDNDSIAKPDLKIIYDLTAILSHKKTASNDESMYTAVVKKRMDGETEK